MTQRNPMNDRYQSEQKGQTKKSAASMKPKSKAAASVYVRPAGKTKEEKKAAQKAQRAKQAELDRKYYNPPTEQYRKLKRLWWILLGVAIVLTIVSMVGSSVFGLNEVFMWACLIPAYGCIIGAIYLDFSKIRRARQDYQAEMLAKKQPKEERMQTSGRSGGKANAAQKDAQPEEKPGIGARISGLFGKEKAE